MKSSEPIKRIEVRVSELEAFKDAGWLPPHFFEVPELSEADEPRARLIHIPKLLKDGVQNRRRGWLWDSCKPPKIKCWDSFGPGDRPEDASDDESRFVIRGSEIVSDSPAAIAIPLRKLLRRTALEDGDTLNSLDEFDMFGPVPVGRNHTSNEHKLFVGTSGSGKTSCFRMLQASQLPAVESARTESLNPIRALVREGNHQAVVYDAKSEQIPYLVGHGFEVGKDLFVLNPFDARSMVWDIAKDITTLSQAKEFAKLVVRAANTSELGPPRDESVFFTNNAIKQIAGVLAVFIARGGDAPRWTLRDLLQAFSSPHVLRHVLTHHPEGLSVVHQTVDIEARLASNIYVSSETSVDELRVVAAYWHKRAQQGERLFSLTDWVENGGRSIVVLPNARKNSPIVGPLNRLLFERLSQLLKDPEHNRHRDRTNEQKRVIYLDECPTLGRLSALPELLAEGRSFGVELVLGVQSISQLTKAYGKDDANTILENCGYKGLLKCSGETAQWASKLVGQRLEGYSTMSYTSSESESRTETFGTSYTTGTSKEGGSSSSSSSSSTSYTDGWSKGETETHHERVIDSAFASEFEGLPDARDHGGLVGYWMTPHLPIIRSAAMWPLLESVTEPPADIPEFVKIESDEELLEPWGDEDYRRLGIPPYRPPEEGDSKPVETVKKKRTAGNEPF